MGQGNLSCEQWEGWEHLHPGPGGLVPPSARQERPIHHLLTHSGTGLPESHANTLHLPSVSLKCGIHPHAMLLASVHPYPLCTHASLQPGGVDAAAAARPSMQGVGVAPPPTAAATAAAAAPATWDGAWQGMVWVGVPPMPSAAAAAVAAEAAVAAAGSQLLQETSWHAPQPAPTGWHCHRAAWSGWWGREELGSMQWRRVCHPDDASGMCLLWALSVIACTLCVRGMVQAGWPLDVILLEVPPEDILSAIGHCKGCTREVTGG